MTFTVKQEVAAKQRSSTEFPDYLSLGKPVFQKVTTVSTLADFVDPDSFTLFSLLKISTDWLASTVKQWKDNANYHIANNFAR
jgi:hypothetical protein